MMTTMLEMLKDSISYWREIVLLFMTISFLKFALNLYAQVKIAQLHNKNTYKVEVSGDRKVIEFTTHESLKMEKIQSIAKSEDMILLNSSEQESEIKKVA